MISLRISHLPRIGILVSCFATLHLVQADPLPQTALLDWKEEDLSQRLMDGAHAYVDRKIGDTIRQRRQAHFDPQKSREKLTLMLGLAETQRRISAFETFGTAKNGSVVVEHPDFIIHQIRWQVTEHFHAEGLLVEPRHPKNSEVWISIPDADETPELALGIGQAPPKHHAHLQELASRGYRVLVPALVNRAEHVGGLPYATPKATAQSRREFLHRQGFHMGKSLLGFEVQAIQTAIDLIKQTHPETRVHLGGYGEGALVALLTGALDERVDTNTISGLLGQKVPSWEQPLHRNLQGFEKHLGLSGLLRLHGPRTLIYHTIPGPSYQDKKGELQSDIDEKILNDTFLNRALSPNSKRWDQASLDLDLWKLEGEGASHPTPQVLPETRPNFNFEDRQKRLFQGIENEIQTLVRNADFLRDESFMFATEPALRRGGWSTRPRHATLNPSQFLERYETQRQRFEIEAMGKFEEPLVPANPRSRLIHEKEEYTAHDVVVDVFPEMQAWAAVLLPKDLKGNEKRPVVVLQHGRNGVPRDLIDANKSAYGNSAVELVKRGFIVLVPHNLYRGEDQYRWLNRKANAMDATLFSFIIPSHEQLLGWVKTLPHVDGKRIAFYGLSYGGESAMRIPPVIKDYSVVICSGDFNQWTRKVAATDYPGSFMYSIEWEMPYWNLGRTFDYAEMAYLIFPRPFMVERGHHDLVAPDSWVAHEFAKVQYLYAQFGMADRTKLFTFQGGHAMGNEASFDFLHEHLRWPKPRKTNSKP